MLLHKSLAGGPAVRAPPIKEVQCFRHALEGLESACDVVRSASLLQEEMDDAVRNVGVGADRHNRNLGEVGTQAARPSEDHLGNMTRGLMALSVILVNPAPRNAPAPSGSNAPASTARPPDYARCCVAVLGDSVVDMDRFE